MKKFNVRAMVEGAIFAALTVIMGIFYRIPVLEIITLFWPVPIIIIGYRHGFKVSMISTAVAAVITSLLVNPLVGLTLLMIYALPGAIIGMMLQRRKSPYAAIFVGGLLLAISAVLEFVLMLHVLTGKDFIDVALNFGREIEVYYNSIYDAFVKSVDIYRSLGVDQETISKILDISKDIISITKMILPISFVLAGIFIAYVNFKVVKIILNRIGYYIKDIEAFYTWRIKESLIMPTFILTAAILLLNYLKVSWMQVLGMNLFTAMSVMYGVLGASVIAYFLNKAETEYEIPKALRTIILIIFITVLFAILPFIGIIDLTADIRRLNSNTIGGVK